MQNPKEYHVSKKETWHAMTMAPTGRSLLQLTHRNLIVACCESVTAAGWREATRYGKQLVESRRRACVWNQLVMWLTFPPPFYRGRYLRSWVAGQNWMLRNAQCTARACGAILQATTNKIKQKLKPMRTTNATDLGHPSFVPAWLRVRIVSLLLGSLGLSQILIREGFLLLAANGCVH